MKGKRYYIAYGSNLSVEQMKYRTPEAHIVGTAILQGWQLLFRQYATIRESANHMTPVLVWEISPQDEKNLDRYEGFPNFYIKRELPIKVKPLRGGRSKKLTAMVYIMTDCYRQTQMPSEHYYSILDAGYDMFGFDKAILRQALEDSAGKEII